MNFLANRVLVIYQEILSKGQLCSQPLQSYHWFFSGGTFKNKSTEEILKKCASIPESQLFKVSNVALLCFNQF